MKVATLLVSLGLVVGTLGAVATPASAQPDATFDFQCSVRLPGWPAPASFVNCDGTITGASLTNPTAPCVPNCPFRATFTENDSSCAGLYVSGTGNASGEIYINGVDSGSFLWLRAGTALTLVPPGDWIGGGTWTPASTPIHTCQSPGPLSVEIQGHIIPG